MKKQNPIRAHPATKIRYFSDRLLGSGLIDQSQKMTAAAMQIAEK
jgi:hypothetical protein